MLLQRKNFTTVAMLFLGVFAANTTFCLHTLKVDGVVPIQDFLSKCSKPEDFPKTDRCYKTKVEIQSRIVIKAISNLTETPNKYGQGFGQQVSDIAQQLDVLNRLLCAIRKRPAMIEKISLGCKDFMDEVQLTSTQIKFSGEKGAPRQAFKNKEYRNSLIFNIKTIKHCFLELKASNK